MTLRDWLRFVGAILAFAVIHELLFDLDHHDMTQGFVFAGVFTVVCALRETRNAAGDAMLAARAKEGVELGRKEQEHETRNK